MTPLIVHGFQLLRTGLVQFSIAENYEHAVKTKTYISCLVSANCFLVQTLLQPSPPPPPPPSNKKKLPTCHFLPQPNVNTNVSLSPKFQNFSLSQSSVTSDETFQEIERPFIRIVTVNSKRFQQFVKAISVLNCLEVGKERERERSRNAIFKKEFFYPPCFFTWLVFQIRNAISNDVKRRLSLTSRLNPTKKQLDF